MQPARMTLTTMQPMPTDNLADNVGKPVTAKDDADPDADLHAGRDPIRTCSG